MFSPVQFLQADHSEKCGVAMFTTAGKIGWLFE